MNMSDIIAIENCAVQVGSIRWNATDMPDSISQCLDAMVAQLNACASLMRDELDRPDPRDIADALQAERWASMTDKEREQAIRDAMK